MTICKGKDVAREVTTVAIICFHVSEEEETRLGRGIERDRIYLYGIMSCTFQNSTPIEFRTQSSYISLSKVFALTYVCISSADCLVSTLHLSLHQWR